MRPDVLALQEAIVDDTYDQGVELLGAHYHVVLAPAPFGRLLLASHGPSWWAEAERELQALAVVRRIEELVADDPAHIVVGADPGLTFEPQNPLTAVDEPGLDRGRRIDYVLVRCGDHGPTLRIADCRLALDQPVGGAMASDHYGVVADLEVKDGT